MNKVFKLSTVAAVAIVAMSSFSGCSDSGSSSVAPIPVPSFEAIAADGYVIDLNGTAATLDCNGTVTYSGLTSPIVGGVLKFSGNKSDDCTITVGMNAFIDIDNNGVFNNTIDKQIGFPLRALGASSIVSQLTSLVVEKKESGATAAEVKALNDLVSTFDPVKAATDVATKDTNSTEYKKAAKLMVMGEILKTILKEGSASSLKDINTTTLTDVTKELDTNATISHASFASVNAAVKAKVTAIEDVIKILPTLDTTKVKVNDLVIQVSDGGKNITKAITESLVTKLPVGQDFNASDIVKVDANATAEQKATAAAALNTNVTTANTNVEKAAEAVKAVPAKLSLGTNIKFGTKSVPLTGSTFAIEIPKDGNITNFYNVAFSDASVNGKAFPDQMVYLNIDITNRTSKDTMSIMFPNAKLKVSDDNKSVTTTLDEVIVNENVYGKEYTTQGIFTEANSTYTGLGFDFSKATLSNQDINGSNFETRLNTYLKSSNVYDVNVSISRGQDSNLTIDYTKFTGTVTVK